MAYRDSHGLTGQVQAARAAGARAGAAGLQPLQRGRSAPGAGAPAA